MCCRCEDYCAGCCAYNTDIRLTVMSILSDFMMTPLCMKMFMWSTLVCVLVYLLHSDALEYATVVPPGTINDVV